MEKKVTRWCIYNIMAIERGILDKKCGLRFLEIIDEKDPFFQHCYEIAMGILENTDITNDKIEQVVYGRKSVEK